MPTQLLEIDNNIQRFPHKAATIDSSRISSKRHSLTSSDGSPLPLALVKTSPRFMADTFASSSARRTPPPSRLPRRSLTPTLSTTMGSNGKTRNWVTSTANKTGIGCPEITKHPLNLEAEDEVPKIKSSSVNGLHNNILQEKPLPSPPVVEVVTSSPGAGGRFLIDASTPPQHPGLGESEPRNWPAFPPKKSGEVRDMKEIAQKDPAEQFPVLSKSLSNRSLSSSASTVKVISEETKFVEGKSVECMATASDHEPNKPAGCYQNFIENSEATGLKDKHIRSFSDESETIGEDTLDVRSLNNDEIGMNKSPAPKYKNRLEESDYLSAENQIFKDRRESNTEHCREPHAINVSECQQDLSVSGDGGSSEENLFDRDEAMYKTESQSIYRNSLTSQDDSSYATATQSIVGSFRSLQDTSETDSIMEKNDDKSDTLSTIYSASSSAESPAYNRTHQSKDDHYLPEKRYIHSNFSRLKPKNSFHSLSTYTKQDINDICLTRRLSPYYAGDECGPVLTVCEEAENVIMGANKDDSVGSTGRWNSCRRKLSYNTIKRRSQLFVSEKNIDVQEKSQFNFNFSKEDISSDEQTLANISSPNSPEFHISTEGESISNDQPGIMEKNAETKGSTRTSSLRSNAKVYERKERPTSIMYPKGTHLSTSADTSITSFPPRVSSLSPDTVLNSETSISVPQQVAADAPVVHLNRQSLHTESSLSINGRSAKHSSAQGNKSSSKTKAAMSNIRGLFLKSPGNSRSNQRASQDQTTRSLRVDAKGSPLYTSRTASAHQSNIAAKRFSVQKSTLSKTPSPIVYTSSRNPSFSKDAKKADYGRVDSEHPNDSVAEVSALVETILEKAHQDENVGKSSMLLAIAQVLVQAATTAKTCESNMIIATQAAKEATISYNMTLENIKEVTRIIKQDKSLKKLLSE